HQAIDRLAADEVRVDDFVYVALIEVGVPDSLRIDDEHRAFLAAIQASRLVDANLAGACQPELLDTLLGVFLHGLGIAIGATRPVGPGLTLVQTEKYMMTVVTHDGLLQRSYCRRRNPVRSRHRMGSAQRRPTGSAQAAKIAAGGSLRMSER